MRLYYYRSDVFQEDTEKSFYWAGFLAADGNISDRNLITLSLKESDHSHVENFSKFIETNAVPKLYRGSSIFRITSKEISISLARFNVVPRKTKTYEIPNSITNHELIRHFIRGYFDGDGWFSVNKGGRISWGICGNEKTITQIRRIINTSLQFPFDAGSFYRQQNIFKLCYSAKKQVAQISNFLWKDSSIALKRKMQIAIKATELNSDRFDIEKMQKMYEKLQSSYLVADIMKCSPGTVLKYCKSHDMSNLKGKRISEAKMIHIDKAALQYHYDRSKSIRSVSRVMGYSPTTIKKYLTIYGIL